jgi:starvation-inducible DNA-binding protein
VCGPARLLWGTIVGDSKDETVLRPTRLDIPVEIRVYLIQLMNQTLASTTDLRSQVKQACWNVKGKESSGVHRLFKKIAAELEDYSDLLADRITTIGGLALGTARVTASQSALPEYPSNITDAEAHVSALAERFAECAKAFRYGISQACDVEDAVTAAIYTDIARGIDKRLSCLEAHLG